MPKGHQLARRSQSLQRTLLPNRIVAIDKVHHAWLEDKETGIDPPHFGVRLLVKAADAAVFPDVENTESTRRGNSSDRRQSAMALVELDKPANVDIPDIYNKPWSAPYGAHALAVFKRKVTFDGLDTGTKEAARLLKFLVDQW